MENNALQVDYSNWEAGKQYPEWMDEISLATVSKGYLLPGETVKTAYRRVANAAAMRLKKPELSNKFFKLFWNGWVGLASPVLSNTNGFLIQVLGTLLVESKPLAPSLICQFLYSVSGSGSDEVSLQSNAKICGHLTLLGLNIDKHF